MNPYEKYLLPRFVNLALSGPDCMELRESTARGLTGQVLEIGFGSGLNLGVLPPEVERLYALDPALQGRKMAAKRLAEANFPVEFVGLDGAEIPLADGSVDRVLSTWTLCTIPDLTQALTEIKRVLKPGGRFHFLEHGLSNEAGVARWQNRLNPFQKYFAGGCNLNRKMDDLLLAGGFRMEEFKTFYSPGPKLVHYMYQGIAAPE